MNRYVSLLVTCLTTLWSTAFSSPAPPTPPARAEIASISLSRTPCEGPCPIDKVILRADGTATYYPDSNSTAAKQFEGAQLKGEFAKGEFARLVDFLLAQKFFDLKDNYTVGMTCQPSHIFTVVYGRKRKKIDDDGVQGPPELRKIEAAIWAIMTKIKWEKDTRQDYMDEPPGLRGVALQKSIPTVGQPQEPSTQPLPHALITIKRASDGREVAWQRADDKGRFSFVLPPGQYRIVPLIDEQTGTLRGAEQEVAVRSDEFTDVAVLYEAAPR